MADLPLALGRNLLSLTYASDLTERASRIAPVSLPLGGENTLLGFARWIVGSANSGAKTFINTAILGGAGAIGFDNQFIGWYVLLERTGESFRITDTDAATQTFTLATWSGGMVDGEIVQLRLTAPGTILTAYSYRVSVPPVIPPPPGVPIYDAEVTASAGTTLTVRDGWLTGGAQPVATDGQHVGRTVRLSNFVADDQIVGFTAVGGVYTYEFADVSAYQVGDWIRRAADLGSGFTYGDINTLITPAFPAGMTVVAKDAGLNTLTVVSRDGGNSIDRILYDTAQFGSGYNDVRIFRPVGTAVVQSSSGSAHTLTVDDVGSFSVSGGRGAVEILIASISTSGKVPWWLEHPIYAQDAPTGIGVRFRTIDRSKEPYKWLGVPNLVPNGVARIWTIETSLPDGWLGAATLGAVGSATPSNFVIGKNTDPLYTRVGGNSLFVSVTNGVLYFPPIPWTPQFVGQRFSTRLSLILTKWDGNAALITLQLGIMQADGTVLPWYEQARSKLIQPATSTAPRPDPPFNKAPAGVWYDLGVNDFDITEPSAFPVNLRPNAGDIANMGAGLGLVACLSFNGGGSPIEGYIDGIAIVPAHEAPADVKEDYDANRLHQDTNVQLAEFGPPQFTIGVDFYDAKRMNPTIDEPDAQKGVVAAVDCPSLGIDHVRRRVTDVLRNMNVPGETRLTLGKKKRRLSDAVAKPPATKPPVSTGTGGGTSAGGLSAPAISLTLDGSNVPHATAVAESSVVRVKFAWSKFAVPSDATVEAVSSTSTQPFTSVAPFSLGPGEIAYCAAIGYDVHDTKTPKGFAQISVDANDIITPYLFWRRNVGRFQDDALAMAATTGDRLAAWIDSLGSGRNGVHTTDMNTADRPMVDGESVRFGDRGGTPGTTYLAMPDISALTNATLLMSVKASVDPPSNAATEATLRGGGTGCLYPDTDGHIKDGFGSSGLHDLGDPTEDLTDWNALIVAASSTRGYRGQLNGGTPTTAASGSFTFGFPSFVVGFGGYVASDYIGLGFTGNIRDVVLLDHWPSERELAAWIPYLRGTTDTPPTESIAASIEYTRSGGDVLVQVIAPDASYVKIAASLTGTPSAADVRATAAIAARPFTTSFPVPAEGETLHVAAFWYDAIDTESSLLTRDITLADLADAVDTAVAGAFTPTRILATETFTVPANKQVLIKHPIRIEGTLRVEGALLMVD